jgi:putative transposase
VDKPDTPKKPISESKAVGIDLGVKTFAVLSDGTEIPNHKFLRKSIDRLKRAQRLYSKKTKGSNNRWKSRVRLARMHEHVANQRMDFINKAVHFLVTHYGTICLETLNVKGMVKNHHLAQSIEDVSFGMFNELLEQKADEYGVNILRIGRFEPSSRMCTCGYVNHELTLSDREWTCPKCGTHHDRDLLAANNIKRFAFRDIHTAGTAGINACGDMITSLDGSAQEAPSL